MSLPSDPLDAFAVIAKTLNFSKAAKILAISQPALSRRIQGLENHLGVGLFIRTPSGVQITEAGFRLLKYVQSRDLLEQELSFDIAGTKKGHIGGTVRLAGYSGVMHPVVVKALAPFARTNPDVQVEFIIKEVSEIPSLLFRSEADFIVTDFIIDRAEIEHHLLGHEEYVAIESTEHKSRNDTFLDVNPLDLTTEKFFKTQSKVPPKYKRSYMHDDPGIINGVCLGFGRAIVPKHSLRKGLPIRILEEYKPMKNSVYLSFRKQVFYPKLHEAVREQILKNIVF